MLKRCPPKKDEINDTARKLHYMGQNTLTISWEKPEKYLLEYKMHFSRKTNRKSEEDKLVHSFNENLRKRKKSAVKCFFQEIKFCFTHSVFTWNAHTDPLRFLQWSCTPKMKNTSNVFCSTNEKWEQLDTIRRFDNLFNK